MKLRRYVYALLAVSLLAIVPQAHGLDILLCNDGGLTSANARRFPSRLSTCYIKFRQAKY